MQPRIAHCGARQSRVPRTPRNTLSRSNSNSSLQSASNADVLVLDFDGVLVDSEPEVSTSALQAASKHWPASFQSISAAQKSQLMRSMRKVRPALVKGFESMVMARMLAEDDGCADDILRRWPQLLPAKLASWGTSEAELAPVFEAMRREWMVGAESGAWLALNQPYKGVPDAVSSCGWASLYIASSKQAHRVLALLSAHLGIELPPDSPQLYASLLPPNEKKVEALRAISAAAPGARLHFVDDRLETLHAVAACPDLDHCRLYLADWGYCTPAEKEAAAEELRRAVATASDSGADQPRRLPIQTIGLQEFLQMLRSGVPPPPPPLGDAAAAAGRIGLEAEVAPPTTPPPTAAVSSSGATAKTSR